MPKMVVGLIVIGVKKEPISLSLYGEKTDLNLQLKLHLVPFSSPVEKSS